jgi:hypothetical protein
VPPFQIGIGASRKHNAQAGKYCRARWRIDRAGDKSDANDPVAVPLGADDTEYFDRGFLEKPAGERRSFYADRKRPATLHSRVAKTGLCSNDAFRNKSV